MKATSGEKPWLADSTPRYNRIVELVTKAPKLSHQVVFDCLSDRSIGSHGICVRLLIAAELLSMFRQRHEGGTGIDTLFSISIDATDNEALVKQGKPDEDGAVSHLSFAL